MGDILFYLISSILFLAIIKESMDIFFIKKDVSYFFSIIVWSVFCLTEIVGTTYITVPIATVFFDMVCCLFFCMILYDGRFRKKLVWAVVIELLGMLTETIVGYIFICTGLGFNSNSTKILGSFISKTILLIILIGMKVFHFSRLKRDIPFTYWCIVFAIPLGSIFVLNTLFSMCEITNDKNITISALLSSAFIMAVNFIVLNIYENLSNRLEIMKQQIIFNKQIELCHHQIQEREESNLNIRNIKHDMQNHLVCIWEYMEKEDWQYAKKYIEDLLNCKDNFKMNSHIESGNIVIDALLNYKNHVMKKMGIEMKTHIEVPYNFCFNAADICMILGNCLDNSIEAVSKIEDKKNKIVKVEIIYRKNSLLLQISNPYIGTLKKDMDGNFVTTKPDAENHGIGLNSVRKATKKYDGLVNISTKNNVFTVQILLYSARENYK